MATTQTDRYQRIESALGQPLAEFVAERRRVEPPAFRPPLGWAAVATEITEKTGIPINRETLRLWFEQQAVTR
jgi:hypothetical protein